LELGITISTSETNPDAGDLALSDAGLEVVHTSLADEVAQRLAVRLRFFRGDWFLNLLEGTPYYQFVLVKSPSDVVLRSIFTKVIASTEGVASVISLDYTVSSARVMTLEFEARLADESTFKSTDYPPFLVEP
jgi:hypothetical protein